MEWPIFLYWLAVALCGLTALATLLFTTMRRKKLFLAVNSLATILMAVGLAWFLVDAPPMAEDYSEQTLRHQTNDSYPVLNIFNSEQGTQQSKAFMQAGDVLKAWEEIKPFRTAIETLAGYNYICDLPEDKPIDLHTPFLKYSAMRDVADIYHGYCLFQVATGNGQEAIEALQHLYNLGRRGMTDASVMINKFIFMALTRQTLNTAFAVSQHEPSEIGMIKQLEAGFTPLTSEEYSMARAFTGEYLMIKNTMAQQITPEKFLDAVLLGSEGKEEEPARFPFASRLAYYFGFKPNRNLRDIRQLFDLMIASQRQHPPDFSAAVEFADAYAKQPQIRNMAGWILNSIAMPSFEDYSLRGVEIKVQSDLLAVTISSKLNQPLPVRDYFNKQAYRFRKEDALLRHPGQDGEYDTPDDIVLGKTNSNIAN
jgi:hypothetical protein